MRARGKRSERPNPITIPREDDRRDLLSEFARIVIESSADGFVMENVRSLLHPRNKPTFEVLLSKMNDAGYHMTVVKADAANYGVPQKRQRIFVLGSKVGGPEAPALTNRVKKQDPASLPDALGTRSALAPFRFKKYREEGEAVSGRWADELREIPPGWNYKYLTAWAGHPSPRFEAETRFWNFLLKLDPDLPSWTINANPGPWVGPFHWDSRRLRTPEMAALQTFPRGYVFQGSRRERVRQIGNAVPVKMASVMIASVLESVSD